MFVFSFSEDEETLRTNVKDFSQKVISPRLKEMEERKEIPQEIIQGLSEIGLLAMCVSEEYGGIGLEAVKAGIVAEEIAKVDTSCAIPAFFLVLTAWSYLLDKYGTKKAKEEILPRLTRGESYLGIASTESDIGSDLASMRSKITKTKSGYIFDGEKMYISGISETRATNGGYIVLAKTNPGLSTKEMSLFYLPINSTGITPTHLEEIGRDGFSFGGFYADRVRISKHYLVGQEHKGFYIVHEGYEFARALIAVACAGAASKSLENAMEYMKQRKAFGRPIAAYEGLQFKLAEDIAKIEAAKLLGYKALWMYEKEQKEGKFSRFEISKAVAVAKLLAPSWAEEAANDAMQWQGAFGYTRDCQEQKAWRGIRSFRLAEGSTEIMRLIVAREVLGKEYLAYK